MPVTYNILLVIASAFIAVAAAFVALELSNRLFAAQQVARRFWLLGGAIAMGTGIWSMHFIAMLAFSIPIYVTYNLPIVLLSLVLAILAALQALFIISRPRPTPLTLVAGSSIMGIGIATMHYSGMAAMEMPAMLRYQPGLFGLSVGIAIVVSLAAVVLSIQFREGEKAKQLGLKLVTACLMGGAVLAMHYTGMAAATFVPQLDKAITPSGLDLVWLAFLVCTFTILILGIMVGILYSQPKRSY